MDAIMETSFKNQSKVFRVIYSLTGVRSNIVEIGFEYVLEIMKCEGHSTLEGCSDIFKAKSHLPVCESTPRENKFHLKLVLRFNLNLVIP